MIGQLLAILLLIAVATRVAIVRKHPERYGFSQLVDPERTASGPYPYVYVEQDGTARELHAEERAYLETRFRFGDGARPWTKWRYGSRALGSGKQNGFLKRWRLLGRVVVGPAPLVNPNPSKTLAEYRAQLIKEGSQIVDNPDGSFTEIPARRPRLQ